MQYALQINSSPYQSQAGYIAYQFSQAALAAGHQIYRIFFYQEGIYHALRYNTPPDDERCLTRLWSALAEEQNIDLVVCISAAQRRGLLHSDEAQRLGKQDNDLADGFRISGLGQLVEATLECDRFLVF